jgi:hypothetical protein
MDGSLTIRGVTKVVALYFTFNGRLPHRPVSRCALPSMDLSQRSAPNSHDTRSFRRTRRVSGAECRNRDGLGSARPKSSY